MKLGKYQAVQGCDGYAELKGLRPGDDYAERRVARYNNTHFPVADEAEYRRRRNRKKAHRGKPVRWFEKYGPRGVAEVPRGMKNDDLEGPPGSTTSPPLSGKGGGTW
jgi:hypothetical protein